MVGGEKFWLTSRAASKRALLFAIEHVGRCHHKQQEGCSYHIIDCASLTSTQLEASSCGRSIMDRWTHIPASREMQAVRGIAEE